MKRFNIHPMDFKITYENLAKNSLQFENICTSESAIIGREFSRLNILIWNCALLDTYLPSIIENANAMRFNSRVDAEKYYMNPQRLSADVTGVTDYWYLILAMNGYQSRFEFKDFTGTMLMPDTAYVNMIVTKYEKDMETVIIS